MPSFQNPAAFLLLLLIPLLQILRKLKIFHKISFKAVLSDWNGNHFTWKGRSQKFLSYLSKILLCISYILVVTAFADPVISHQEKIYTSLGTDVIFVVDTSPSMAAKDINGSMRLDAAKSAITTLTQIHDGYRFGIVGLGSNAGVIVPPTSDSVYFSDQMKNLYVGGMGNGSAIGDGLSTAVCHLVSSSAPKKCIILLTDGENNAGEIHPETAAKLSAENDITLYVVGIGSRGTVPIEYTDPITGKLYSGYLDSDYNPASLKKIAGIGGGRYFEVRTIEELLETLSTVAKIENVSQSFTYKNVNKLYYQKVLFIALIIIVIVWFIKRLILKELVCYKIKKILILRSSCLGFAFIMLILAYSGISWGTYLVPVQKNGSSVSMVFDISNSMLAKDGPNGTTRMKAAGVYAKKLLTKMEGVATSVVLAKGEGIAAIPLTEDDAIIESLLDVMNPGLMTVPGTSIGKGIIKAKETFPANHSAASRIWVFTDGEETDGQLVPALTDCLKAGIPVTIIGFGTEKESKILAGDGQTEVLSALRSNEIENAIQTATDNFSFFKNRAELKYINSQDKGSAFELLSQLRFSGSDNLITSYEAKPVPRYKLFLILAILSFVFSYIFTEIDFSKFLKKTKLLAAAGIIISLTSCSSDTINIFRGTTSFNNKQYKHAISCYMEVIENNSEKQNPDTLNYSLYDLGTTYATIGEDEAALERYSLISEDAPIQLRYAAFYNSGVVAHKNEDYEAAMHYFRKALEVDSSKLEAKINLELSMRMGEEKVKQSESNAIPAAEHESSNPDIEKAVFQHIKENDQKQWKNSDTNQSQNLAEDY